jgi:DNA polymerase III gamma/tau subunit
MGSQSALINKYRPTSFDACLGNEACIKALSEAIHSTSRPHAYLLTGASGIGKTTLARIIAKEVDAFVNEIDAASKSGVADTRHLVDISGFKPLEINGKKNVMYIVDECFAPGSLVDIPEGKSPIELLKEGDKITNALGYGKVRKIFRNWVDFSRILLLTLEDGTTIITTKKHAFLTARGWVNTEDLQIGETLTSARQMEKRQDLQQELLELWDPIYNERKYSKTLSPVQERINKENLSCLCRSVLHRSQDLLSKVCSNSRQTKDVIFLEKEQREANQSSNKRQRNLEATESSTMDRGKQEDFREEEKYNFITTSVGNTTSKISKILFWLRERISRERWESSLLRRMQRTKNFCFEDSKNQKSKEKQILQRTSREVLSSVQWKIYSSRTFKQEVLQSEMRIDRKDFSEQRRKWKTDSSSIIVTEANQSSDRISYIDSSCEESIQISSLPLQCRSSSCTDKTSNRGRWRYASSEETTLDRSQENRSARSLRVASIQSLESRSDILTRRGCQTRIFNNRKQALFYDLGIEDHPSYSIEGVIVHNCGSLSDKAWEPLLKLVEEPPDFLYIALCTTETHKIPRTHLTRAYPVALKPLKAVEVEDLIATVAELEGWTVADGVFQAIVQAAGGSARLALNILQAGHNAKDRNELSQIILQVESDDNPAIKLISHLMRGQKNWKGVSQLLAEIDGNEEDAIIASANYIASRLVRSEEDQAKELYTMLRAFTETETWNKKIHYYTAIGKILWGQLPF